MSNVARKRKYKYLSKRQKSLDYGLTGDPYEANRTQLALRRLKSIDEKDSTEFERATSNNDLDTKFIDIDIEEDRDSLAEQIKLAAIYDDDGEVVRILTESETNGEDVQAVLAKNDERGQPCIFYALESRSRKALVCLLHHVRIPDCVIAENGESVLHVATKMGDIDILRRLLKQDFVVDLVDHVERENGRAPLHLAAKFNHVEIAKELLLHGAKLDREDSTGKSPLYMAASSGHADMLRVFLEHEKYRVEDLVFNPSYGRGIYKNILHVAMGSGDECSVQVCLEQDLKSVREYLKVEVKHGDGYLIHGACQNGMEKCLLRIVDLMGHLDTLQFNCKDKFGFTPIHKAAMNNHSNLVKYIGSISKLFVNATTGKSETALILATQHGHIKVVQQLLDLKADFTTSDDSGRTVLHYAIAYPEILKLLLQKKDVAQLLINSKEKDGYTPVHSAALRGLSDSVRILLEHGADLNVFTNTFRSPLHCAVSSQCSDVVELVVANEPALVNKADCTGKTPLHTAASYGSAKVVKCLLDNGAKILRDGNLFSPLHIAAHKGHVSIVEMLIAFDHKIIDWANKYGRTALLTAASTCKTDVMKYLLDKNAAITDDYELYNCLDWSLIKSDKQSAMMMMCHDRWKQVFVTTKHGTEVTMTKLVCSMPDVAHRVLSNCMTTEGHCDSKDHWIRYNFMCLQNLGPENSKSSKPKPLIAIKSMVRTNCYSCLCHPVCCKYLKAKWMDFGWKIYTANLFIYLFFLISLNVYAFGIPTYHQSMKDNGSRDASINVKLAMFICIICACVNVFKEIVQVIVYKYEYFLDQVNYLECVLYISTFLFAVPKDGEGAVKTSVQWMFGSIALFCAWLNLVMYLRRFASYGIIILMMRRISVTLIKVMFLLIFFLVAFAAAFSVLMDDRLGYRNFALTLLTSAVMTMGEFDFKETFLKDTYPEYKTFYPLRIVHLTLFIVVMPIIIMNLLLALAIDDTSSIMQQAKLQKHIQTAKMIIDLERRRSRFWCKRAKLIPTVEERPNKVQALSRTVWEFICYGPDFTTEQDDADQAGNTRENLTTIINMMKELQQQNAILQNKMLEIQNEFTVERNRRSRERIRYSSDKQHASTQFHGYSESINPDETTAETKRKVWGGIRRKNMRNFGTQSPCVEDFSDIKSAEQDVFDDKEREIRENDPELKELKELHDKVEDEYDSVDGDERNDDKHMEDEEREIGKENEEERHSRLPLSLPQVDVCKTEIEV